MNGINNEGDCTNEVWHADGVYAKLNRPSPEFEKLKKFIQANPNISRPAIVEGFDCIVTPDDIKAARLAIVDEGGPPTGAGQERATLRKRAEDRKQDHVRRGELREKALASQRVDQERLQAAIVSNLETKADLTERTGDECLGVSAFRQRDKPTEDPLEFAQRVMDAALRNATTGQLLAELQRRHGGVGVA